MTSKKLPCPRCETTAHVTLKGHYIRTSDGKIIRRFYCKHCRKSFSTQTYSHDYRLRRRNIDQQVFRSLCYCVSQRGIAALHGVSRGFVARRVIRFAKVARRNLRLEQLSAGPRTDIVFDEMESFEHTKCKPLTIPLAVEEKTRKILYIGVAPIPAKGLLAKIARKKYGPRKCRRAKALNEMFAALKGCCVSTVSAKSDQSPHYPARMIRTFPKGRHTTSKGRRGCVVGQGELKAGGFDPLFSLNQTAAMIRDRIKRMSRRTWTTTKDPARLLDFLHIYAWYHNLHIAKVRTKYLYPFDQPR